VSDMKVTMDFKRLGFISNIQIVRDCN